MAADYILTIDYGTQGVRALLFDPLGNMVDRFHLELEPYFALEAGWAEQDPEYFWRSTCAACQGLWRQTKVPREAIAGVALTTQRSTVINVDRQGEPLRLAMMWLDQRRTEGLPPVGGLWGLAFRLSGMRETVAYLQAEAEANWIR
ncbi:MAG: carbohydrate kinase, partial [Anaerolineae bacterium]|nr:carbohydrate kinase [Anaerolineae bacterium]